MSSRRSTGRMLIVNGRAVTPRGVVQGGSVGVEGRRIVEVSDASGAAGTRGVQVIDAQGGYICPALVEMHIHGCGGVSFHDQAPEGVSRSGAGRVAAVGRILASRGVGLFVPTVWGDERLLRLLAGEVQAAAGDPALQGRVGGIYVEGPFVSPLRRGAIPRGVTGANEQPAVSLDSLLHAGSGFVKLMTFAPECVDVAGFMARLRSAGVIPAVGHSDATFEQMESVGGPLNVTHLFNAMSGVSHHAPGVALWALLHRQVYTEVNGDGVHLHGAALELVMRVRPSNRIILISDAVSAAGTDHGEWVHGGRRVVRRGSGVYYADDGVLVGSASLITDVVRRVVDTGILPVHRAVAMASRVPLALLGYRRKGVLEVGWDADIAVFDGGFRSCRLLMYEGRVLHPC